MQKHLSIFSSTSFAKHILANEPMSRHTTLKVGGPADYYIEIDTTEELKQIYDIAKSNNLPLTVLGGGSNVLVSDEGLRGIVVAVVSSNTDFLEQNNQIIVRADAGVWWDNLVKTTIEKGLQGLECLSGIPGRVGAVPVQNIGAYGAEASEVIKTVRAWNAETGGIEELSKAQCGFGYRTSNFKTIWSKRYVVMQVDFVLQRQKTGSVRYPGILEWLKTNHLEKAPTPADVRQAVLAVRQKKSMLLDANDPNTTSVGSFFVNPIISKETVDMVIKQAGSVSRPMPQFPQRDGSIKLSAAWLIEEAGFPKGYQFGAVGLSKNHVLAIINLGGAKAADVIALASCIRQKVRERFSITLKPEPVFLGFQKDIDDLLDTEANTCYHFS